MTMISIFNNFRRKIYFLGHANRPFCVGGLVVVEQDLACFSVRILILAYQSVGLNITLVSGYTYYRTDKKGLISDKNPIIIIWNRIRFHNPNPGDKRAAFTMFVRIQETR